MLKYLHAIMKPSQGVRLIWAALAAGATLEDICRDLRRLSVDVSDAQRAALGLQDLVTTFVGCLSRSDLAQVALCMTLIDDIVVEMKTRVADLHREIAEVDLIHRGVRESVRRHVLPH